MRLIIVSGLSGSGKTVALRTLEDAGFYSIDNLPLGMLPELVDNMVNSEAHSSEQVAVAIDARSGIRGSAQFDAVTARIAEFGIRPEVLFLTCEPARLLQRFSETRRRHPLSREGLPLADAIREEKEMLDEIHAMIEDYEDGIYVDLDRFSRTLEAWFGQHFSTHDARLHRQLG